MVHHESGYYQELSADRTAVVPVVGAGLSLDAGVPSFLSLVTELAERARRDGLGATPSVDAASPFDTVDQLAAALGDNWLQDQTASIIRETVPRPTPALMAIARVTSGLVVTTNYDDAIERAAAEVGRPVVTLTSTDLREALAPSDTTLRVLHLHGVATNPSSIVLSSKSYSRVLDDDRVQLLLRDLGLRYRFVFVGHGLAAREQHIRRELRWVAETSHEFGRHLLATDVLDPDDGATARFWADVERETGIHVMLLADPERRFEGAIRTAAAIAGPSSIALAHRAPTLPEDEFDRHYVPEAVADLQHITTEAGQGEYVAHVWSHGETLADALDDAESRLVLVASAGMGKSEELRQIGRRTHRPSLFQPLVAFHLDQDGVDPVMAFVTSMNSARGVIGVSGGQVPRLTPERLADESYVFLLDGLDEVTPSNRWSIVRLIGEISARFPQHRYVLTSRPGTDFSGVESFAMRALVPSTRWLATYLDRRGIPLATFEAVLPADPGLAELVTIPVFAAAAADDVASGTPVAKRAVDLVGQLADRRAEPERVGVRAELLRTWLDRVAVLTLISGVTEVPASVLAESTLHSDLGTFAPNSAVLRHLASRALLADVDGNVRFPTNVLREGRAARHLLESGLNGLAMLTEHALVERRDVVDAAGRPVQGVRSDWMGTLELLLPAAPQSWRTTVAAYDPLLAARTTPTDADADERDAAVWTLWSSYAARRVWIGTRPGSRGGDQAGLIRLLQAHVPDGFAEAIRAALFDPEHTRRGNAVALLPQVVPRSEALERTATLLADIHPVVRRRAAVAARELEARELTNELVSQAHLDDDEMASSTLMDVAIDLAPDEAVGAIALAAPPRLREEAVHTLVRRVPRDQLLDLLQAHHPFSRSLLAGLVERSSRQDEPPWTEAQIESLATITAAHPVDAPWVGDLEVVLRAHPVEAALARLRQPRRDSLRSDVSRMAFRMTPDQLQQFEAQMSTALANPTGDESELDHEGKQFLTELRALVTRYRQPASPQFDEPEDAELSQPARPDELSTQAPSVSARDVEGALGRLRSQMASGDDGSFAAIVTLEKAAALGLILTEQQAQGVLEVALYWPSVALAEWLLKQREPAELAKSAVGLLPNLTDHQILNLAQVLPTTWPARLSRSVLDAATRLAPEHPRRLQALRAVAARDGEVLRHWAREQHATWADRVLLEHGDAEAEDRLLRQLIDDLPTSATIRGQTDEREWTAMEHNSWLQHVRSANSVGLISQALCLAHKSNMDISITRALASALTRSAGLAAPAVWEVLVSNQEIPDAPFLDYDRREAVQRFLDEVPRPPVYDVDLQRAIRELPSHT